MKRIMIAICILVLALTGCNSSESQYQKLVKTINSGVSIQQIEELIQKSEALGDGYKDNKQVKLCLEAYKAISENELTTASVYLFTNIPEDYSGDVSSGIEKLRVVFKEKAIPRVERLIKERSYVGAKTLLNPVKDEEGFAELWNYAAALIELDNDYKLSGAEHLYKISFFYEGPLAEEIKRTKAEFEADPMNKYIIKNAKPEPVLGMTMYEAEFDSSWGTPEKRNISKGSYGVHEQWVYGSGKYLYIENGIVTGIDESK